MGSYANFRNNAAYQSAATALGTTVKKASQTKAGRQQVKSYAAKNPADAQQQAQGNSTSGAAPNPSPSGDQSGYSFGSIPGQMVNTGIRGLVDFGNKYKDNETVGGIVAGKIGDIYGTTANTGLAIQYNDAFLNSLGTYQQGLENLKTGNTLKLMGAEGAITNESYRVQGDEMRKAYETQGQQQRLLAQTQGETTRYVADRDLEGNRYTADRSLDSNRYVADRSLEGEKYRSDSEERRIGLMGEQERLTQADKTTQERRLRADARGAIASQGARFYG